MNLFPVEYATLSSSELLQWVVSLYQLNSASKITFLKRGFNDTYLIYSDTEKYILRVYNYHWRTAESVASEINLLNDLKENDVRVSSPVKDSIGNYIQQINAPEGLRYAVLFTYAEGVQIKKMSIEQSFLLGIQVGKIHAVTNNKNYGVTAQNYDISYQFDAILKIVKPVLVHHSEENAYLLKLQADFKKVFDLIPPADLSIGVCHGDLQAENFHVSENNQFTFFDFDFFGQGCLAYDIGVFMWYDHKNKPPEIINSFLKGYATQRKLSETEIRMLPYFSTLRALFQMSVYCKISDGKRLPAWPPQQVADFIKKVEKWYNQKVVVKI